MRRTVLELSIAVALAACGGGKHGDAPHEPPHRGPDDPVVIAEQIHDALAEMTVTAETHTDDCAAMAAALTEVFDRVRPLFTHVAELQTDPETSRDLTAAARQYADEPLRQRMLTALTVCAKDQALVDAMAQMPVIQ